MGKANTNLKMGHITMASGSITKSMEWATFTSKMETSSIVENGEMTNSMDGEPSFAKIRIGRNTRVSLKMESGKEEGRWTSWTALFTMESSGEGRFVEGDGKFVPTERSLTNTGRPSAPTFSPQVDCLLQIIPLSDQQAQI